MKANTDILNILQNNIHSPAFILDFNGQIIAVNSNVNNRFYPGIIPENFFELFNNETNLKLKTYLSDTFTTGKNYKQILILSFQDGRKLKAELSFSKINYIEPETAVLCTIELIPEESDKVKFSISSEEIEEIILDKNLLKIFHDIKSSFPFTLLGRTKIKNDINKLDEFFWLKDTEGKYIIVNNKFANNLGLKPIQVENRFEKEFLPKYLTGFYEAMDEFIQNTSNIIIKEGINPPILLNEKNKSIIEFPLCDLDNRVIAVIGLTIPVNNEKHQQTKNEAFEANEDYENLNLPIAVFNPYEENRYNFKNKKFREFEAEFLKENQAVFSNQIFQEIQTYLNNPESTNGYSIRKQLRRNVNSYIYIFKLLKLFNKEGKLNRILLQVEKDNLDESNILNDRGKMYEIIMQASPEPIYIYDIENLRFLEVNNAALELYGYSKNEFLQMDLTDLYAPEDIQTLLDSASDTATKSPGQTSKKNSAGSKANEGVFTGPWRHRKRDGNSILVEISKASFDYKGSKAHFNIVRDVTEKIELQKDIQLFKPAFENTSDMVLITDNEGFITYVNESVLSVLGYTKKELDTRPFITLVSDQNRSDMNSLFYSTLRKPLSLDLEFRKKDGDYLKTNVLASPVFDFNDLVISYNIIAKLKPAAKAAPEIIQTNRVENHVESQKASSIDPALLSSMFHEILTPMNVILGFIQEITENITEPSEETKEAIDIILQNRDLLLQTMDSVLEYSHIEQNRVEITPQKIFFTEIIDNLQKNTKKVAVSNNIEFGYGKISSSLNIETDVHRLESLVSLLLTIAMRITKEKKIFISAYQLDDQNYIISLKDGRKSISKHLLDNLYKIFTEDEKNLKKEFGVSKLSISLSRKLLTLLLGRGEMVQKAGEPVEFGLVFPLIFKKEEKILNQQVIPEPIIKKINEEKMEEIISLKTDLDSFEIETKEIISEKKEDQEFSFNSVQPPVEQESIEQMEQKIPGIKPTEKLPIKKVSDTVEKPNEEKAIKSERIDISNLSCLYVEDQVDSQILYKVQLKELKQTDFAVSFEAALPFLENKKFDFIVMDINLQGEYNGLDALRIIRKLPGYEKTPIIAVTAYVLPGDKEKFIAAGFNDFISKPILREKLIDVLNRIFI